MCSDNSNGNGHGSGSGSGRRPSNLDNPLHGWGTDKSATRRQNGGGSHGGDRGAPSPKQPQRPPWGW